MEFDPTTMGLGNGTTGNLTFDNSTGFGDGDHEQFLISHYTVLIVTSLLGSAFLAVVSFWLREVCFDRYGIEFCSGSVSTARRREIRRHQLMAIQLQRQIDRDLNGSSVAEQEEWKRVYGSFLRPFGKVLKEQDFQEVADEGNEGGKMKTLSFRPLQPCAEFHTEATCIICFKDYEVDEEIVWSSMSVCRHVYHKECMLRWISTGKKKCPLCRNYFVPSIAFEDMKAMIAIGDDQPQETMGNLSEMASTVP